MKCKNDLFDILFIFLIWFLLLFYIESFIFNNLYMVYHFVSIHFHWYDLTVTSFVDPVRLRKERGCVGPRPVTLLVFIFINNEHMSAVTLNKPHCVW